MIDKKQGRRRPTQQLFALVVNPIDRSGHEWWTNMHVGGFILGCQGYASNPPRTVATSATFVHHSLPPHIRTSINPPRPPFERQPPDKVACGDIACENVMHRGCKLNSTARHANQFHGCSALVVLFLFARSHVECRRIMRASIGSFTLWYLCGRLFDRRSIAGTPISQPKTVRSSPADAVEVSSGVLE